MRAFVLIAALACRATEPPPALHNTAPVVPAHPKTRTERARAELARAYEMRAGGFLITAYAAAQGGLNILAGEPPNQDADLEASDTPEAELELRMMVDHRIHELEVKLGH